MTSHEILTLRPYACHRCSKMYKNWFLMIKNIKMNVKNTKIINYWQKLMHAQKVFITRFWRLLMLQIQNKLVLARVA